MYSLFGLLNDNIGSSYTALDNSSKILENQTYIANIKLSSMKFENKEIWLI